MALELDDDARQLLNDTLGDQNDDFVRGYMAALGDAIQLQMREAAINTQSLRWLTQYAQERGIGSA